MTQFTRGDVVQEARGSHDVARDGRRAVVWSVASDHLLILPVANFGPRFAGDVAIEAAADRITFRKPRTAVIRTSGAHRVPIARQVRVGRVSDWLLAELIPAARRSADSASWCAVWSDEIRHRRRAFAEQNSLR